MRYSLGDLELMYDGRIPDAMRQSAIQSHALSVYRPRRRVPLPKVRRQPATAEDMAGAMLERASVAGCCTDEDLLAAGFTRREIDRLSHRARERASAFNLETD